MSRGRGERDEEFVAFTAAHRADLLRTATLLCAGDSATAEDLVQTTLTRLYLSWRHVRVAQSRLAYARASLTNAYIDEMRRAHRRRETYPESLSDVDAIDEDHDVVLRRTMLAALASLGPRQRAVVVLRHWHDLDVDQTARLLGCSPGTVKSQNARALARLRQVLDAVDRDPAQERG
ncbi:MAG: SigE family RNA polymerase sigma factor [Nocardioides sp.]